MEELDPQLILDAIRCAILLLVLKLIMSISKNEEK